MFLTFENLNQDIRMSGAKMVGPERCRMVKPDNRPPKQWPGTKATGSYWIRMRLDSGWKIIPHEGNHLVENYRPEDYITRDGAAEVVAVTAQTGNPLQAPQPQPTTKRGPGRPRKNP